tara:strand:- start:650 stop:883 length:234 start_codon:yes stop_codon:yes gene_type:complete
MRPISVIARDISLAWPKPFYGAVPYLGAMRSLETCADTYWEDSGLSIVAYFLSNASSFKGEAARTLKAELKAHMKAA